jgi:hypothetical protein
MSAITVGVDAILLVIFIVIPTIASIVCKKKDIDTPIMFKIPMGVKITVAFTIIFTIYFSQEMTISI